MSYLVIYPKQMSLHKLDGDQCCGSLLCDVLQYGLLVEPMHTPVEHKYLEADQVRVYRVRIKQMEAIPSKFVNKFERSLNEFLFRIKALQPQFESRNGSQTWTVHFSDICFLLAGETFEISSIKNISPWPAMRS